MLDSPRSPDECRKALLSETGVLWSRPVLRSVLPRGDAVVLKLRHMFLRSGLQMIGVVTLRPGGHGTEVVVTVRSEYFGAAFITLWSGFAVLFAVFILGEAIVGAAHFGFEDLIFIGWFLGFGIGFITLNRLIAHPDRARLLDFIGETTGGHLVTWPA